MSGIQQMFVAGGGTLYATWNPSDKDANVTLSNGNLTASCADVANVRSTIAKATGKWYWEITVTTLGTVGLVGVGRGDTAMDINNYPGSGANGYAYKGSDGDIVNNGADTAYGATFTDGDVIGVAWNGDTDTVTFYKNGASQGDFVCTNLSVDTYACVGQTTGPGAALFTANFGASAFAHSVPSGFNSGLYTVA